MIRRGWRDKMVREVIGNWRMEIVGQTRSLLDRRRRGEKTLGYRTRERGGIRIVM